MPRARLVFLGSDGIALPLLNWLAGAGSELVEIAAVYTQPDRAVGRGQKVVANDIKGWAVSHNIPVVQPEKLTEEVRLQYADIGADLAVVMAYGHILRDDFIATPRLGTLNLHASILPSYRGASPIQTAIAQGETQTGVSLMRIVRRLDAGPVADIERVPVDVLDTALDVERKLAAASQRLIARNLHSLIKGGVEFLQQDDTAATFCRRLEKSDGVLDFTAPARTLAARINGLFPWPACGTEIHGQFVKFGLADVSAAQISTDARMPGAVLGSDADGLLIGTGTGVLRVRRMQRPGGKMLEAADFLRGFPIAGGTILPSVPMPELLSKAPFKK